MSAREKYHEIMGSLVCLLKYSAIGVFVAKVGIEAKVGGCSLGMSICSYVMSLSISAGCVGVFLIVFVTICWGTLGNPK